jgi:outer membrane receptor protein involved in Fe transport
MRTANTFAKMVIAAVIVLITASAVFPATVGKIRGRVIDKKTKDPVPAVAISIEGTSMGALSDPRGEYIIINVPPGNYSLKATSVAYNTNITRDVQVTVDHTTVVDFELEERITELDIVQEVVAQRDLLKLSETQNIHQITAENIKNMPVTSVEEILSAQVGVVKRFGELHVRGGRANEVTYVVDGVEVKDPLGGYGNVEAAMNVSGNVVEDLQIIKGGFDAEYGNATSGIVTIATKSGGDVTKGHLEYFTDDFGTDILNKNSFNYDRVEFNLSGPDQIFAERLFPAIGIDWFRDRLKYSLSGSFDKTDQYANYKMYSTPAARRLYPTRSILGIFDMQDRSSNQYEAQAKVTWQATPQVKLTLNYRGSWDDYVPFAWNFRYTPGTASWTHEQSAIYALQLTHQLDKSTFYEVSLSRFNRNYLSTPSNANVAGGRVYPDDFVQYNQWEYFQDKNGNGVFDQPEPFINVNQDTSWYWGGPFYTVGDAYIYEAGSGYPIWPTLDLEWGPNWATNGPEYGDWRGVDVIMNQRHNSEAGYCDTILTDWNGNGLVDFYESEPFEDVNGDGRWNANDYFYRSYDSNNNGVYDASLASPINQDNPEPYQDGDVVLGEPFTDVNLNGVYDEGIDIFVSSNNPSLNQDLNYNSRYDGPGSEWSPGLPFEDLNGNGVYDAPNGIYDYGEPYLDLNQNGKWDPQDGFLDKGYDQWTHYNDRKIVTWSASFKINKQFSKEHEVKSGINLDLYDLNMGDLQYAYYPYDGTSDGGPWPNIGVFRDFYTRKPILGSMFFQDRMEYGAMVANIGLRYDFFIQSADLKTTASEGFGDTKSIKGSENKFSPRIGFSYPISDKAKVFFNYGHFYQLPELNLMYQRSTQASNAAGIIGNENLDYEKTIQYEFGVTYQLSNDYVLDLSGFYKDEFGKINSVNRSYGPITRNEYENLDYGRSRGLEGQLEKKYGNYVSGYISYSYQFAYGKSSSERSNYFDDFYNRSIPITEFPLNWDQRHMITLNLDLRIPPGEHPKLFGLKLPDNWGFNTLWQFGSGFPFTPDRDYPGLKLSVGEDPQTNSLRYPATSNVDLRAWKRFQLVGLDFTVDLWIDNLFDNENIAFIYGTTGRYNTNSKPVGANYVYEGTDISQDPTNLDPGRNIRIGLGVDF